MREIRQMPEPDADREQRLRQFLETKVWPTIPPTARRRWSKDEEDAALGYGEWGEPRVLRELN